MTSGRDWGSDENRVQRGMDISRLARDFGIDPDRLETALADAAALLRESRLNIRPADKKALRGLTQALARALDRLSEDTVQERLVQGAITVPDGPDEDGLAYYTAWWEARARVERALAGAQDLLALVRAGESYSVPAGRPPHRDWAAAIGSLVDFWVLDLGHKVTISDHPDDARGIKPSPAVDFIYKGMRSLGEPITVQACRSILKTMRKQDFVRINMDA